ncbi:MAG: DEAD/DEAH box helicase [Candidatus Aminicenantes bacterium]|nr:DEAD/DEAH box helicase [Candidatus Aminicenantes bacterium]
MDSDFRNSLFGMFSNDPGRHTLKKKNVDYARAIANGALGVTGENYYFFIFKDLFEKQPTYGGIYFLYSPFNFSTPVQMGFKGPDSLRELWNFYLGTAAFFIKNNYQDTMTVSEPFMELHRELLEIADKHSRAVAEKKEKFQHIDFNALAREFQAMELAPNIPVNKVGDATLPEKLKILKPEEKKKTPGAAQSQARLGLSLVASRERGRKSRFQPVIIPIKKSGVAGALKPAVHSQMDLYEFDEAPGILNDFTTHLHDLSLKREKDPVKIDMISQVYFEALANLMLELPDDATFCQINKADAPFFPLKKMKFAHLDLYFAPMRTYDIMQFYPVLTGSDGRVVEIGENFDIIIAGKNKVYLLFPEGQDRYCFAVPMEPAKYDRCFRFMGEVKKFLAEDFNRILEAIREVASDALEIHPEPLKLHMIKYYPTPVLKIFEGSTFLKEAGRIEVEFDYDSRFHRFLAENPGLPLVNYEKDHEFETLCLYLLKSDPLLHMEVKNDFMHGTKIFFTFKDGDDFKWLMENSPTYMAKGFRIYSARQKQYIGKTGSKVRLHITPGMRWLEFKPLLENAATGETFEIDYVDYNANFVTDKNGILHLIDKEDIDKLSCLARLAERHGGFYRVPSENYFLINVLYDRRMDSIPALKEKLLYAKRLEGFKQVPHYEPALYFNGKLRIYQEAGFRWLRFLHEYRFSGCLADDMGLGKTVQTLALFQSLKEQNQLTTSLLVMPVSAVSNWEAEIARFTPGLTFHRHLGAGRDREIDAWTNHDLVITSYATLRNDVEIFSKFPFDYIVLDESQNIKNLSSQVTKAVKLLKGEHRLALSGTPIENTTMELWSLFDFLMPGFLGTPDWFRTEWALRVEKYKDEQKTELLKNMIYPFILRRKKEEVEKDLPEKTEMVEKLSMEEEQLKLYVNTAQYYSERVLKAIDEKGVEGSAFVILEGMLRLRQVCLFPQLVDPAFKDIPSIKFGRLIEMLEDILSEGHKVLVFSQFVKVLEIIRLHFDAENIDYSYIDGSLDAKTRGTEVKQFQEDETKRVFLLSLKAGGVAINLTAADYVIIFDPWWNPAVEAQAIDRSHRIGQTKKVFVYRMVVKDTIEEKMLALQEQKRELVDKLITSESKGFKDLTREDIIKLFQ